MQDSIYGLGPPQLPHTRALRPYKLVHLATPRDCKVGSHASLARPLKGTQRPKQRHFQTCPTMHTCKPSRAPPGRNLLGSACRRHRPFGRSAMLVLSRRTPLAQRIYPQGLSSGALLMWSTRSTSERQTTREHTYSCSSAASAQQPPDPSRNHPTSEGSRSSSAPPSRRHEVPTTSTLTLASSLWHSGNARYFVSTSAGFWTPSILSNLSLPSATAC